MSAKPHMLEHNATALKALLGRVFEGFKVLWLEDQKQPRSWRNGVYEYTIWGECHDGTEVLTRKRLEAPKDPPPLRSVIERVNLEDYEDELRELVERMGKAAMARSQVGHLRIMVCIHHTDSSKRLWHKNAWVHATPKWLEDHAQD